MKLPFYFFEIYKNSLKRLKKRLKTSTLKTVTCFNLELNKLFFPLPNDIDINETRRRNSKKWREIPLNLSFAESPTIYGKFMNFHTLHLNSIINWCTILLHHLYWFIFHSFIFSFLESQYFFGIGSSVWSHVVQCITRTVDISIRRRPVEILRSYGVRVRFTEYLRVPLTFLLRILGRVLVGWVLAGGLLGSTTTPGVATLVVVGVTGEGVATTRDVSSTVATFASIRDPTSWWSSNDIPFNNQPIFFHLLDCDLKHQIVLLFYT